jgi:hypothetical protein
LYQFFHTQKIAFVARTHEILLYFLTSPQLAFLFSPTTKLISPICRDTTVGAQAPTTPASSFTPYVSTPPLPKQGLPASMPSLTPTMSNHQTPPGLVNGYGHVGNNMKTPQAQGDTSPSAGYSFGNGQNTNHLKQQNQQPIKSGRGLAEAIWNEPIHCAQI